MKNGRRGAFQRVTGIGKRFWYFVGGGEEQWEGDLPYYGEHQRVHVEINRNMSEDRPKQVEPPWQECEEKRDLAMYHS